MGTAFFGFSIEVSSPGAQGITQKITGRHKPVPCIALCTPGMGVSLWGASPLYENQIVFVKNAIRSTSRRQGRKGDQPSEGSPLANVRVDEQKPHTRLSPRASWHNTTKPIGSGDRVNAAVVHGKFTFLSGEICAPCDRIAMRESGTGQPGNKAQAYPSAVSGYESSDRETRIRQRLRIIL